MCFLFEGRAQNLLKEKQHHRTFHFSALIAALIKIVDSGGYNKLGKVRPLIKVRVTRLPRKSTHKHHELWRLVSRLKVFCLSLPVFIFFMYAKKTSALL